MKIMKYVLKLIPHTLIIAYLASLLKEKWTSRTITTTDDEGVDKIFVPSLDIWWRSAIDPDITWEDAALATGLLVIDFTDKTALKRLKEAVEKRQKLLEKKTKK